MKYKLGESKYFEDIKKTLYQIVAVKDFGVIKKGDIGGWVENEKNLSHDASCWVFENARVFGDARVGDDFWVCGYDCVFKNVLVRGDTCDV